MPESLIPWLPAIAGVAIAVVAGGFALWQVLLGDKVRGRRPLPPTWPEMWARIDALEQRVAARDRAFANILAAAAAQWPSGAPGPVFDDEDIAVLEDTIPAEWLIRRPPRPKTA